MKLTLCYCACSCCCGTSRILDGLIVVNFLVTIEWQLLNVLSAYKLNLLTSRKLKSTETVPFPLKFKQLHSNLNFFNTESGYLFTYICSLHEWYIVVRQEDELYVGFLCYLGDDLRTVYSWQQPDCELWQTGQGCCHRSQVWQAWQWEKLCYRRWQGEREREKEWKKKGENRNNERAYR